VPFAVAITLAGYLSGRLARLLGLRSLGVAGLGAEALGLGLLAGFAHSVGEVAAFVAIIGVGHRCLITPPTSP
jgi:hypothetical protein